MSRLRIAVRRVRAISGTVPMSALLNPDTVTVGSIMRKRYGAGMQEKHICNICGTNEVKDISESNVCEVCIKKHLG